jgi:hypothetical protein
MVSNIVPDREKRDSDLRPWFVHLNKYYTYYQLALTLRLPSKCSIRIDQLIRQFRL